jgi:isopenicillin-N N-acyltransferase-like protein
MRCLSLSGSPYERGCIYGESLRSEIADQIQFFRSLIQDTGHCDPDDLIAHTFSLGWKEAAERWTPGLVDEVRGIATGAALPFTDLFSWQCVQEIYWYLTQYAQNGLASGCSALADAGDTTHPTLLAQNADTIPFWHQHQVLLRLMPTTEEEPELLIMTYPGLIGPCGLNSAGVGVCVNALFFYLTNSTQGLCTPFLTRGILSKRTFEEAIDFIKMVPHASGNALTIGAPGKVIGFEASANQVVPFMLPGHQKRTCHTNHVLVSDDFQPGVFQDKKSNSHDRLEILENTLTAIPEPLSIADVKGILSLHGENAQLCRHEDDSLGSMTTYCMIMELSQHPRLHVTFGPPCRETFHTFDFSGGPGANSPDHQKQNGEQG